MRVVVDVERCRGAGQCTRVAPEVFDQDEQDGTVVVLVTEPPPELHHVAGLAAQLCPNAVIRLEDERASQDGDGGPLWVPVCGE
jgi:ferredoxin